MSAPAQEGGSEDVNDFLQRIKELGDRRDQEDEERNRKLEEEILQGRKERQARRERARSISPTKSSPANTPTSIRNSGTQASVLSQPLLHTNVPVISPEQQAPESMESLTDKPIPPTKATASSTEVHSERALTTDPEPKRNTVAKASPSNAMPSRNSPLAWQRRPESQSSEPRIRALSTVAVENAARSSPNGPTEAQSPSPTETTPSRDQIAQSLASKDPAWFRQTADRGLNSPAYRSQQVEDEERSDHGSSSARVQMPGMARGTSEPEKPAEEVVDRSTSPSRGSISYGSSSGASYQAHTRTASALGSPIPLTAAQRLDPPSERLAMSPSQGRISPDRLDRSPSPTKGMGGFVQSAMMKRSDSVSKRWSVQSPSRLTRGNSIASSRSSHDLGATPGLGNASSGPFRDSRNDSISRDASPRPGSRPSSSHSNATVTQERPGTASSIQSSITDSTSNDGFAKPFLPASRTQTTVGSKQELRAAADKHTRSDITPPASPTKTADPRRWSPTKSSWLESALNKPDSPKPKAAPPPQQPAWMAEINKAKAKGSVDLGRAPTLGHKHEVSIGGLMRSPPPGGAGAQPLSMVGLPTTFSPGLVGKSTPDSALKHDFRSSTRSVGNEAMPSPASLGMRASASGSKEKPETPPKKDFRAHLKSRQHASSTGSSTEPEFKNLFGQLRQTKTQNYVAPDELKANITRGKAGLNLTGGPQKTERVDEFKEAILQKKKSFYQAKLEGKGVTRSTSIPNIDSPLPEALARRKTLVRSDSSVTEKDGSSTSEYPLARRTTLATPRSDTLTRETSAPGRLQAKEPAISGKLAGRLNPALAGLLARGPPAAGESSSSASNKNLGSTASVNTAPSEPGPQLTHITKGRARGPRRKAPSSVPASTISPEVSEESAAPIPSKTKNLPSSSETNTQVATKSRDNVVAAEPSPKVDPEPIISQPSSPRKLDMKRRSQFLREVPNVNTKVEPQLDSPKPLSPVRKANIPEAFIKAKEPAPVLPTTPASKPKPSTPIKSPLLSSRSFEAPSPSVTPSYEFSDSPETLKLRPAPLSPSKTGKQGPGSILQSSSNSKHTGSSTRQDEPKSESTRSPVVSRIGPSSLSPTRIIASNSDAMLSSSKSPGMSVHENPAENVKSAAAKWSRSTQENGPESVPRVRSPIKLPTHEDEKAAMIGAGLRSASPTKATAKTRPLPIPPPSGLISPRSNTHLSASSSPTKSLYSPISQASEATRMLDEFFTNQGSTVAFNADTATILAARPDQETEIKTLRASLYQISSDRKKQQVPSHQERILFEENLYLCFHTFGTPAGKKVTEVYFWLGDGVYPHVVKDLEAFAQKEAKIAGGKLVVVRQGKETPEFFQALGGIIIIRRGSANKFDSLAPHILCARKHFGQIALDEVDFSSASLCSGFPYLISTQTGKSYLWKGKGSGIDELSCARLIGMDFGLTGEVEEVEDGNEPASFLEIFATGAQIPKSADHWRMKPNYNKYCTRLFCADSTTRQQIIEINPFCQSDFDLSKVYILDAFFEIYIIVGSRAQAQYASFQLSLMFAQEYGILAAGMEDRPFVPVTTVVLEGVPKDMKGIFRKWNDSQSPTFHEPKPLQRGRSLRVVPLTVALEATMK